MMDLIDKDKLMSVLNDHWLALSPKDTDSDEVKAERAAMCRGLDYAFNIVADRPAVEAVPLRRTKPVMGVSRDHNWWQCGNCESVIDQGDRYCRGCGAEVEWRE